MWLYLHNSVWTGTINRTPTPTECALRLFMYNQCLHHEHVIFTHVHQRLHPRVSTFTPHAPTIGSRFIVPAYYGMYAAIIHTQPMFIPRTPTVGSRFIVPAYHGMHGVDILCFICFVFHLCHSICALMIFLF